MFSWFFCILLGIGLDNNDDNYNVQHFCKTTMNNFRYFCLLNTNPDLIIDIYNDRYNEDIYNVLIKKKKKRLRNVWF